MIVDDLISLRAAAVLAIAAERGLITELACAMLECRCPEGRNYFEPTRRRSLWAPSPDRWPIPGRNGGKYTPDNVRLSHFSCNVAEGGRFKRSPEQRARMSEALRGNHNALGNRFKQTDEAKAKLSASLIGNQRGLGRKPTDEARANMSVAQKARQVREHQV